MNKLAGGGGIALLCFSLASWLGQVTTMAAPVGSTLNSGVGGKGTPQDSTRLSPASELSRMWYGQLYCQDQYSRSYEAEVEIRRGNNIGDNNYQLGIVVNYANSMKSGTIHYSYVGEDSRDGDGSQQFVLSKVTRGNFSNYKPGSFKLVENTSTKEIVGTFSNGTCQRFTARNFSVLPFRTTPSVAIPSNGGSFNATTNDRDKCEAVINWTDKLTKEFGDTYKTGGIESNWKRILLFSDDDFVPTFGIPYDHMNKDALFKTEMYIIKQCTRKDPFTKGRMDTYRAAADRIMMASQDLTSDGYDSTVFALRHIRQIRHEVQSVITSAVAKANAAGSFEQQAKELTTAKTEIDRRAEKLWPSEQRALSNQINSLMQAKAKRGVRQILETLAGTTDPREGLKLCDDGLANGDWAPLRYIDAAEREAAHGKISSYQEQFAKQLAAPLVAAAIAAPRSLEGIRDITRILDDDLKNLTEIKGATRQKFTEAIEAERHGRLETLTASRLQELAGFPSGKQGLSMSAKWYEAFENDFKAFQNHDVVKSSKRSFSLDRIRRLKEALPEFTRELRSRNIAGTAGSEELVASYLSLPGDAELPISLEYSFLSNNSGIVE